MANYQSKYSGQQVEYVLDNAILKQLQPLTEVEQQQVKDNLGIVDPDLSQFQTKTDVDNAIENALSQIPTPDVSGQISEHNDDESAHPFIQETYVKKDGNKVLSSNDFTDTLKNKLEGLEQFDPSLLENDITLLNDSLDSLNQEVKELPNIILEDVSNDYVNKEEGKGLSTNDFTNEDKQKLEGLSNYDDTEIHATIDHMYELVGSHNKKLEMFCIEPVTVVVDGVETLCKAGEFSTVFVGDKDFSITPTSEKSIKLLTGYPIPLSWHDWMEGVDVFSNIIFDMNELETYHHWNQGYQGEFHVQKAQYINCVFWSDLAYVQPVAERTNYTLYNSAELPLCYSSIRENTFKPFYFAYGVTKDPNWSNEDYIYSFSLTTSATQPFSYYGARTIGVFNSAVTPITLPKDCRGLMFYSPVIESIGVLDAANTTNFGAKSGSWGDAFGYCSGLTNLYIRNLKASINVSWSPINVESIKYIINNAINTSKITISVSPYTWNRLTDDIKASATEKNITIALITTNYQDDIRWTSVLNRLTALETQVAQLTTNTTQS